MNVFQQIKSTVTARQATEFYGLTVNRYAMARCPFHDNHTPSKNAEPPIMEQFCALPRTPGIMGCNTPSTF